MVIRFNTKQGGCQSQSYCPDAFGCSPDQCPDFVIKRHDTKPSFRVQVEDCDGPLVVQGLVAEVNMWAKARLKAAITEDSEYFQLADNIGFEQVMQGDIIVMDRVRLPEHMLVTGFDEINKLIRVERGYRGTVISPWKKGNALRIFRVMDAPAKVESVYQDVENVDGTIDRDVLTEAYLVYDWSPEDVCLPGCYWLEFKLIKMIDVVYFLPGGNWIGAINTHTDGRFYTGTSYTDSSVVLSYDQVRDLYLLPKNNWLGAIHIQDDAVMTGTIHDDGSVVVGKLGIPSDDAVAYNDEILTIQAISFTSEDLTPDSFGCLLGDGIEWIRRFPLSGEAFLIKVEYSPTTEI